MYPQQLARIQWSCFLAIRYRLKDTVGPHTNTNSLGHLEYNAQFARGLWERISADRNKTPITIAPVLMEDP